MHVPQGHEFAGAGQRQILMGDLIDLISGIGGRFRGAGSGLRHGGLDWQLLGRGAKYTSGGHVRHIRQSVLAETDVPVSCRPV